MSAPYGRLVAAIAALLIAGSTQALAQEETPLMPVDAGIETPEDRADRSPANAADAEKDMRAALAQCEALDAIENEALCPEPAAPAAVAALPDEMLLSVSVADRGGERFEPDADGIVNAMPIVAAALSMEAAPAEPPPAVIPADDVIEEKLAPQLAGRWTTRSAPAVRSFGRKYQPGTLLVRNGERKLYYFIDPYLAYEFPIGVGRRGLQKVGMTRVTMKRTNPTWVPTVNQHRYYRNLPRMVPPGLKNPLGTRALNLTIPNYRIHGTHDDSYINAAKSDGCYRMYNHDIEYLFEMVSVGALVILER